MNASPLGFFERYLSVWVGLSILAGIGLGTLLPGTFQFIARLEYANVNLVVAVLIWVMIYPMMASVDFGEFGKVDKAAVIDAIGVHSAYAGSGIGHALLSQLLLNLSTLQVEYVRTQVSPGDFNLKRFLHACGFHQSQRLVLTKSIPTYEAH